MDLQAGSHLEGLTAMVGSVEGIAIERWRYPFLLGLIVVAFRPEPVAVIEAEMENLLDTLAWHWKRHLDTRGTA